MSHDRGEGGVGKQAAVRDTRVIPEKPKDTQSSGGRPLRGHTEKPQRFRENSTPSSKKGQQTKKNKAQKKKNR